MNSPKILIAGAGLGGLTAAIALVQRGFDVTLFEQAPQLGEVGAGLTVSRSAQSVFKDIGLTDQLLKTASLTSRMAFLHYADGRMLAGEPDMTDGRWDNGRAGGMHIHRADLHGMLAARFEHLAPGRLHKGKKLADVVDASGPVRVRFADGSTAEADMVIGADGIRSSVREKLWGGGSARFTGQVAYRFLVDGQTAAPWLKAAGRAAVYLGPKRVFNRYSLRQGAIVNCVAITQSEAWQDHRSSDWSTPAAKEEMLALYEGWHPDVLGLMSTAPQEHLIKWALFDRPSLPGWLRGRTTLLGDAAHPMLPFLGMGAAMAIEDAMILARALEKDPTPGGLALYEDLRRDRTDQIATLSRIQGEISQDADPDNYDPSKAPAQDPSIQNYDPVTISLKAELAA